MSTSGLLISKHDISRHHVISGKYPRGGTLIFSHIRRLGPFFGVQNSEFQYFLGFSEKLIFFGGMKILWMIFWGASQNWASLRVIFMQFRVFFLRSRCRIGIFLGVAKISNIFWGCLKFLIFFLGEL